MLLKVLSLLLDEAPVVVIVGKELAFVCLFIELVVTVVDVVELVLVLLLLLIIELEYLLNELDEDVMLGRLGVVGDEAPPVSSLRGGKRSLTLSRLLASSNEICFLSSESLPSITLAVVLETHTVSERENESHVRKRMRERKKS